MFARMVHLLVICASGKRAWLSKVPCPNLQLQSPQWKYCLRPQQKINEIRRMFPKKSIAECAKFAHKNLLVVVLGAPPGQGHRGVVLLNALNGSQRSSEGFVRLWERHVFVGLHKVAESEKFSEPFSFNMLKSLETIPLLVQRPSLGCFRAHATPHSEAYELGYHYWSNRGLITSQLTSLASLVGTGH